METEKSISQSPIPIPTPIPIQIQTTTKQGTGSKTKTRNPKSKFKKSKSESASATIIYVPVLVQSLPSDTSAASTTTAGKSGKTAQPVLNEQQMKSGTIVRPTRRPSGGTTRGTGFARSTQTHRWCSSMGPSSGSVSNAAVPIQNAGDSCIKDLNSPDFPQLTQCLRYLRGCEFWLNVVVFTLNCKTILHNILSVY